MRLRNVATAAAAVALGVLSASVGADPLVFDGLELTATYKSVQGVNQYWKLGSTVEHTGSGLMDFTRTQWAQTGYLTPAQLATQSTDFQYIKSVDGTGSNAGKAKYYKVPATNDWDAVPSARSTTATPFSAYCVQLSQSIVNSPGDLKVFTVKDLSDAPVGGGDPIMGGARATQIKQLWTGVQSPFGDGLGVSPDTLSGDEASAFQVAIWEIINETSGTLKANDGYFKLVTNSTGNTAMADTNPVVELANKWLADVDTGGAWSNLSTANLYAMTQGTNQDQVFLTTGNGPGPETPLPSVASGFMALVLGGLGMRRRLSARRA